MASGTTAHPIAPAALGSGWVWQLVSLVAAVWLILAAMPVVPAPMANGLDPSWVLGINIAHTEGLVHGRDIVWTYGPLGYLSYPASPLAGMYAVLLYRLGVYLLWGIAMVRLALLSAPIRFWVIPFLAVAAILDPVICSDHLLIALFTWCLVMLMDSSHWRTAGLVVAAFLTALACMIKANSGVLALGLLGSVMIGFVLQERGLSRSLLRRMGGTALLVPVFLVALYARESGTLATFPAYLRYSLEMASGYSEAMSLNGDRTQAMVAAGSIFVLFVVLPLAGGSIRSLAPGYLPAVVYAFFAFKSGLVRQDAHAADFELQLALAALFLLVVARGKRFIWLTIAFQIACLFYAHSVSVKIWSFTDQVALSRLSIVGNWPTMHAFLNWPQAWANLERESVHNLAPLAASPELQSLVGRKPVEAVPWNVAMVRENGWNWRPRPIFQSYAAYTPTLDGINAAYLESSRAAEIAVVSFDAIDGHHPFLETPLSWRTQIDRYRMVTTDSDQLVLSRRNTARFASVEPVSTETTTWDRVNRVPQSPDPMVVSAHIGRSLSGRVRNLLFRSNPLFLLVTRQSGTTERYRALRANFADGVIMNELPVNLGDLALLATSGCTLSDPVVSFQLQTDAPGEFDSNIRLAWSRLVSRLEPPANCVQITRTAAKAPLWGGAGRVPVTAGAGVTWSATANDPWIKVETEGPRTGNATVRYSVLRNSTPEPREGSLAIGGQVYKISQPGPSAVLGTRTAVQLGFYGPGSAPAEAPPSPDTNWSLQIESFNPLVPEGQPVMGDWTGDGRMRIGVFHNGSWYLDLNGNRRWDKQEGGDGVYAFGLPGDIAVPGDWAGDGKTRLAVFRHGEWIIDMNGNMAWDGGKDPILHFGLPGDIPVMAKWSHDRSDRMGIFRNGTWIVDSNGDGAYQPSDAQFKFGGAGDTPLVSLGNGHIGVFRKPECLLLPSDGVKGFDPKTILTIPCNSAPMIGAW